MNNDFNNNQQQPYQSQQPQQGSYQQPPQGSYQQYPGGPTPPGKGAAIGSMVCGIISLVAAWLGWGAIVGLVLGIVASVLSVNAKKQGYIGGMATAGMVMGIIGTILSGIVFAVCVACTACSTCVSAGVSAGGLAGLGYY